VLAHHFLEDANRRMGRRLKGFTNAAMDRLVSAGWTGNVRELENEIERIVALAGEADTITLDMLSEHVRGRPAADDGATAAVLPDFDWDLNRAVDELKRRMIQRALEETGSKSKASERLGIPRQSLQKMMKRLGMRDAAGE
jgi:transcriptional regulator with PAS, ATPase and Fis domain